MKEIVFPFLGTIFVVVALLPACALLAKAALWSLERTDARGPLHGLRLRYLVLAGSSALPLVWLLSAAAHQAESGRFVIACLFDHGAAALCFEPGLFTALLGSVVIWAGVKETRKAQALKQSDSLAAREIRARLNQLVSSRVELAHLAGRLDVADADDHAVGVQGFFAPRVVVGAAYAMSSSDDEIAAALGHEAEHVRARDPLRYLVLSVALAVNPLGRRLLQPHAASWLAAREAHCDREAVIRGAQPLPLAQALVRAARPSLIPAAALGARNASLLKLRVEMLMAFQEQRPARCCHREPSTIPIIAVLLIVTALLPHHTSTAALDALHLGTEHALHFILWR